ncbi:MAG: 50S ribosomal protein L9 [Desulfitobacteriia bacterium]
MKVILIEDVKNLGTRGDVCKVQAGYARNFLIPRGLAVEATKRNMQDLAQKQKQEELQRQKEKEAALEIAEKIKSLKVVIKVKTGEKGRLFGSVTNKEIAEVLDKEYQVKLDRRKIEIKEPIKALGEYEVMVRLHPEVTAMVIVAVEAL